MRKSFYIIHLILILGYFQCQSQSLGFEQTECGIITNSSYSFVNFYFPSHGRGYFLLHNGDTIYGEHDTFGGPWGMELRFIDDSSGYFIVQWASYPSSFFYHFKIYRIVNNSVTLIGNVPGTYYDFFIVSRHTLYFTATMFNSPPVYLSFSRLSDILPQKDIISSDTLLSDTTVFDTIAGIPFCPGLNEINYRYQIQNNTIIYTIRFSVDTLVNIRNQNNPGITVYPNPAKDYLRIETTENENPFTIQILDNAGIVKKSIIIHLPVKTEIYIGDLIKGIYFIVVDNSKTKKVYKLIII